METSSRHTMSALNIVNDAECWPRDVDDDEDVSYDEAPNTVQVIKMYQCSQEAQKMNNKKHPQNQSGCYNLRSQGAPPMIREM